MNQKSVVEIAKRVLPYALTLVMAAACAEESDPCVEGECSGAVGGSSGLTDDGIAADDGGTYNGGLPDADWDGLPDAFEISQGLDPNLEDTNQDGCLDFYDWAFPECAEGDLTAKSECRDAGVYVPLPGIAAGRMLEIVAEVLPASQGQGGSAGSTSDVAFMQLKPPFEATGWPVPVTFDNDTLYACGEPAAASSPGFRKLYAGHLLVLDANTRETVLRYRFFVTAKGENDFVELTVAPDCW